MSLPPSTIRIKRKLDEAPVQALYVDRSETKRQKVKKDFVFRLARTVTSPTDPAPQPFQPQHHPRNSLSGIPQVRSTLTPASRSRPSSPSLGVARTLVSRTPSPGHGIGPLPAGSKLALDTSDIGSSRKSKFKVPLSAIARADSYESVNNVESPATIASTTPIGEKGKVPAIAHLKSSDDSEGPVRKGTFGDDKTHSLSTSPPEKGAKTASSPSSTTAGKRKAAAAVRRYHLAKRLRVKHPHPYSTAATRRSAIFVRESSEPIDEDAPMETHTVEEEKLADQKEEPVKIRKRPRTHPEEKKRIEEEKRKLQQEKEKEEKVKKQETNTKVKFEEQSELDPLTLAMQNMVFEYLNSENNDGIRNLVTNPPRGAPMQSKMQDKIGGGLGGGTWKDVDKGGFDEELEDEEGFIYDVYIREEVKPENSKKEGEDYGLIIINGSDDEEWWYEGDDDVDSDDVYGSDDEDSNAEDYHTNDYPEEPAYDSDDADEVDEFGVLGIDSADDGDDDDSDDGGIFKSWNKQKKFSDEEEFDLEYDEDVDAEAEDMRRKMAGIWGYRDGGRVTGGRVVVSGDEMED
ncbi:uncharacterized protein H6S33_001497 [Morchella sextelata]|uniref:uncharacterized protein n=1 Tax=Morchella sextelata TaxID=1174677 RepID=UPI001D057C40|nr:uncharacterized protein H6S33_001497 [Morchella sextelata]KAH0608363.1 hypothetical protein H6S33_001497 [Morchella sextelata]